MDRLRDRRGEGDGAALPESAGYTIFATPDEEGRFRPLRQSLPRPGSIFPKPAYRTRLMMLDLRNTNALMFRNPKGGEYNMVYRREDGTIGWVEPSDK